MTSPRSSADKLKSDLPVITVNTLVIGGGISGLMAAGRRLGEGKTVMLAEAGASLGGRWSPETREGFTLGAGLFFSDQKSWQQAYRWLGAEEIDAVAIDRGAALSFAANSWEQPEDLPPWEDYFARPVERMPRGGLWGFMRSAEHLRGLDLKLHSPVTEVRIIDGAVESVLLGNSARVVAQEYIWTANAKALHDVLTGAGAPEAGTARLAWLKQFVAHDPVPGVVLEFAHDRVISDFSETLLLPLPAGDKEERRYVVGAFLSNRDSSLAPENAQLSSWIFPVSTEIYEDNHELMKRIRAARRALEKAFPAFQSSIRFERVQVLPHTVNLPKRKSKQKSADTEPFSNLFLLADWAAPEAACFEAVVDRFAERSAPTLEA